jgi:putative endonuclease
LRSRSGREDLEPIRVFSLDWCLYILSNANRTLYVGITPDLTRRFFEHRTGFYERAFTKRYNFDLLVYYEYCGDEESAKYRERQMKHWRRARKIALIEAVNPAWRNLLSEDGELSPLEWPER